MKAEIFETIRIPGSEKWSSEKKMSMLDKLGGQFQFNPVDALWDLDTIKYRKSKSGRVIGPAKPLVAREIGESDQAYIQRVLASNSKFKKEYEKYDNEIWRPVNKSYLGGRVTYSEEKYLVSQFGRIMILDYQNGGGCKIKIGTNHNNRYCIDFTGKSGETATVDNSDGEMSRRAKPLHANDNIGNVVAHAFIGPRPDGAILRYKDGNTYNNRADNLYWG